MYPSTQLLRRHFRSIPLSWVINLLVISTLLAASRPVFANTLFQVPPDQAAPDQASEELPQKVFLPAVSYVDEIGDAEIRNENEEQDVEIEDLTLSLRAASNPIPAENQNPGDPAWRAGSNGRQPSDDYKSQMLAYTSATSVNKGERIDFHVSVNPAQNFTLYLYRMGWYSGTGGRLMQTIGPIAGIRQPACPQDAQTGMTECHWSSSYTLTVPISWTTGIYMAVLVNAKNFEERLTFAVRDDSRVADFLYQQAVTTYQAYNDYPHNETTGKNLYDGGSRGPNTVAGSPRAVKVSFDRPGGHDFERWEVDLVQWLERNGYDVAYTTDVDTHLHGERLLKAKAVFSVGHDEYWSQEMRDAFEQARDGGVHLAFFGANAAYWQIRFEASSAGVADRTIVCYKDDTIDPEPTYKRKTILFRDIERAEQALIGVQYKTYNVEQDGQPFTVQKSDHWFWNGAGVTDGSQIPGIVGYEIDRRFTEYPGPTAVSFTVLGRSPYVDADQKRESAESTLYQAPSGAWVFASGTIDWSWGLNKANIENDGLKRATRNLLARFLNTATPKSNLALGKPVEATSIESVNRTAAKAVDGDLNTRWASQTADPQTITIDLGAIYAVKQVVLAWETAYGRSYQIQLSKDSIDWRTDFSTTTGDGNLDLITLPGHYARYVRLLGTERGTRYGYSLWEFSIHGSNPRLTGRQIGTPGSFQNEGNSIEKCFDNEPATFFDAPVANEAWCGLDLGKERQVTKLRFHPRLGKTERMIGGRFQASNSEDFSRNVVDLYIISTLPPNGWKSVTLANSGSFRYVRYLSPDGGWSNVAEIGFYGQ